MLSPSQGGRPRLYCILQTNRFLCGASTLNPSSTRFGFSKTHHTSFENSASRCAGLHSNLPAARHGPRMACSAAAPQRHHQRPAAAAPQYRHLHLLPVPHLRSVPQGPGIFPPWRRYAPALRCEGSATNVDVAIGDRLHLPPRRVHAGNPAKGILTLWHNDFCTRLCTWTMLTRPTRTTSG